MRIRVIKRPPLEAKHGIEVGQEHEVLRFDRMRHGRYYDFRHWVKGAAGEEVALLFDEVRITEATPTRDEDSRPMCDGFEDGSNEEGECRTEPGPLCGLCKNKHAATPNEVLRDE